MKQIELTQGKFAIVDDCDYLELNNFKWHAHKKDGQFYAVRSLKRNNGKQKSAKMHRQIMGVLDSCCQIDHRDGNTLDNRRRNLRACTSLQNSQNRKPHKNSSSIFKGVGLVKITGKWRAQIMHRGKKFYLGSFCNETDAAKAYDKAAERLFGDFAYLNFTEAI